MLFHELAAALMNLEPEELAMIETYGRAPEVQRHSEPVATWLRRMASAEAQRRTAPPVAFPEIDDSGWTDAAAGGALAVIMGLVEMSVGREKLRDFADALLKFFAGVAINRLRARTIAASN